MSSNDSQTFSFASPNNAAPVVGSTGISPDEGSGGSIQAIEDGTTDGASSWQQPGSSLTGIRGRSTGAVAHVARRERSRSNSTRSITELRAQLAQAQEIARRQIDASHHLESEVSLARNHAVRAEEMTMYNEQQAYLQFVSFQQMVHSNVDNMVQYYTTWMERMAQEDHGSTLRIGELERHRDELGSLAISSREVKRHRKSM